MNRPHLRKIVFSALVGILICFILLIQIKPLEIFHGLRNIIPIFTAMYVLLNMTVYLLRTWRFRILIGNNAPICHLYPVVAVHTMFINLFPLGTGELTYPYLLKKRNITEGFGKGIPSLILARLFDFMVIGIFFVIAVLSLKDKSDEFIWFFIAVITFVCILVLLRLAAERKEDILSFLDSKREHSLWKKYSKFLDKIPRIAGEILAGFEVLKERHILLLTLTLTVCSRFVMYLGVFFLLKGIGLNLTFMEIVFLSSFYILLPLVPVNTIAGFGTTEALLVILIMGFGYSKETSVIASFQIHILQLSIAVLLGLVGFFHLWIQNRQSRSVSEVG